MKKGVEQPKQEIPPDFAAVLAKARLTEFFAECTASHQREYLKWIGEAKRTETRRKRMEQAAGRIAEKCAEEQARAQKKKR